MESRLSRRVKSFPPSGIRRIFDLARQPGVISLAVGEPDFGTPLHIRAAAKEALDRGATHYGPNLGEEDLRRAISARMARTSGLSFDPGREIIVTAGGAEALYLAMGSLLDPGDEVLIPDPGFMVYNSQTLLCGAIPSPYPLRCENGFCPDPAELEALVTPRTKLLIINSPRQSDGAAVHGRGADGVRDPGGEARLAGDLR